MEHRPKLPCGQEVPPSAPCADLGAQSADPQGCQHAAPMAKLRLDALLVQRGLCQNATQARGRILAGEVLHGRTDHLLDKPGIKLAQDTPLRLRGARCPYVSRGGLKLEAALQHFHLDVQGWRCLDVGASTGGFTDCLLHHGAKHVVAVDVGYGQLAMGLRQHAQITVVERFNIRHAKPYQWGEPFDLVVADVSFIGLGLVLPHLRQQVAARSTMVLLIKPQFEVGRHLVGKGGIVRDEDLRQQAVAKIVHEVELGGWQVAGVCPSPIVGAQGNQEYLLVAHLRPSI